MRQTQSVFKIEAAWPDADVLYLQGLPCWGITDPEGKLPGWQRNLGELEDRDLKFVDAALTWAKANLSVDTKRIYAMGHSNGGAFTYCLWQNRPGLLAAIGSVGAGFRFKRGSQPVSAFIVAGKEDPLVPYATQEWASTLIRRIDRCDSTAETPYEGAQLWKGQQTKQDVLFITHPGGHEYPDWTSQRMVDFFKQHPGG
jgi:polyhydroxybutyrate depolymerase